jgi:hypothetical protein
MKKRHEKGFDNKEPSFPMSRLLDYQSPADQFFSKEFRCAQGANVNFLAAFCGSFYGFTSFETNTIQTKFLNEFGGRLILWAAQILKYSSFYVRRSDSTN